MDRGTYTMLALINKTGLAAIITDRANANTRKVITKRKALHKNKWVSFPRKIILNMCASINRVSNCRDPAYCILSEDLK